MKMRILYTLFLLTILSVNIFAQDYVKAIKDCEVKGKRIIKGEIFSLVDKNKIIFGKDTVSFGEDKFVLVKGIASLENNKLFYIKKSDPEYQIDFRSFEINGADSIKLITSTGNIISLPNNSIKTLSTSCCGEEFRIIIPNRPSLIYSRSEIHSFQTNNDQSVSGNIDKEVKVNCDYLLWGIFGLVGIVIASLSSWYFLKKRFDKTPLQLKYAIYPGGDFNDFAKTFNISLKQLYKMNKDIFEKYELLSSNQKERFRNNLGGKDLIIGFTKDSHVPSITPMGEFDHQNNEDEIIKTFNLEPSNSNDFIERLRKAEMNIINKIESLSSNRDATQKIENQQSEIESLKEKRDQYNKDRDNVLKELNVLQVEFTANEKEKQRIEADLRLYTDKVIFVDFLEPYARVASEYFSVANAGYQKAIELFKKLSNTDPESSIIIAQLLLKYQSNIPQRIGNWDQILVEIKENKVTSNSDLIRSFMQIPNIDEKLKEFKRILFKEIFEKYSSSLLILAEELCKLNKFTNANNSVIQEFEQYFIKFGQELQNKTKAIGLELNFVPLFENYTKYAAFTKLASQSCSLPYRKVHDLEKDAVLEVISYGFGNEETKVILA